MVPMNGIGFRIVDSLRRAWRVQVQLQGNRTAGWETSGQDALHASRMLRWDGERLVGDLLIRR